MHIDDLHRQMSYPLHNIIIQVVNLILRILSYCVYKKNQDIYFVMIDSLGIYLLCILGIFVLNWLSYHHPFFFWFYIFMLFIFVFSCPFSVLFCSIIINYFLVVFRAFPSLYVFRYASLFRILNVSNEILQVECRLSQTKFESLFGLLISLRGVLNRIIDESSSDFFSLVWFNLQIINKVFWRARNIFSLLYFLTKF